MHCVTHSLVLSKSFSRSVKLLNRIRFSLLRVKSDSWEWFKVENSFYRTTFLTLIKKHSGSTWVSRVAFVHSRLKEKKKKNWSCTFKKSFVDCGRSSNHLGWWFCLDGAIKIFYFYRNIFLAYINMLFSCRLLILRRQFHAIFKSIVEFVNFSKFNFIKK